jgi:hypothetical protein
VAARARPESESPAAKPEKVRKPDEPVAHVENKPAAVVKAVPQSQSVATPRETASEPARPEEPPPVRPTELKEAAPRVGPEAREIRLEVAGADQRVEVRLTERGGEVRVAVRTADSRLAGSLRENLPALSSRLTESGFRTETWHPASAPAGELHRVADSTGGSPARDANPDSQQHGNGRQSDAESRHPKAPEEQIERKEKGKDFAWLMSSLQ